MIIHIGGWSNSWTIVFGDCASQRVWFQSFCGVTVRMQCITLWAIHPNDENESRRVVMAKSLLRIRNNWLNCFCYSTRRTVWINFNIWGAIIWKRNENNNRRRQLVAIKINLDCCYLPRTLLRNKRLRTKHRGQWNGWMLSSLFSYYFCVYDEYMYSRFQHPRSGLRTVNSNEEFLLDRQNFHFLPIVFIDRYYSENAAKLEKSKLKISQFLWPFL